MHGHWERINQALYSAMAGITLYDLSQPVSQVKNYDFLSVQEKAGTQDHKQEQNL